MLYYVLMSITTKKAGGGASSNSSLKRYREASASGGVGGVEPADPSDAPTRYGRGVAPVSDREGRQAPGQEYQPPQTLDEDGAKELPLAAILLQEVGESSGASPPVRKGNLNEYAASMKAEHAPASALEDFA
ncbi:hypothetical protein FACS1894186_2600 [Alphaproteobacteria bacterium]|nr:hypothetical protein FACS1894186_2600 [Alphaproteobacteria bacterium]